MDTRASRIIAYNRQNGRCYYCGNPIWERAIEPEADAAVRFAEPRLEKLFDTPRKLLDSFACTAEHLVAREHGGTDLPENIVAACMHCNSTRMSMPIEEFRLKVRQSFFHMEAGHDRSVVDGEWRDNVAYDFRWKVTLFIESHPIWIEIFCQKALPYTKFFKNHWHLQHNNAIIFPAFDPDVDPARSYSSRKTIEGARLMLENLEHEPIIRAEYAGRIAASA